MQHLCGCPEFGEYTGMVELVPPEFLKRDDDRGICVDVCLALEITNLWKQGIKTLNSCCGHGRLPASIIVDAESEKAMEDLGCVVDKSHIGFTPIYLAKTELEIGENTFDED